MSAGKVWMREAKVENKENTELQAQSKGGLGLKKTEF